jgi:hypothetical protein
LGRGNPNNSTTTPPPPYFPTTNPSAPARAPTRARRGGKLATNRLSYGAALKLRVEELHNCTLCLIFLG